MIAWIQQGLGWYHSIDLPLGLATPGARGWDARAKIFDVAGQVRGKTVLDLGAMEGGDSFFAEEMGAVVTAYDVDCPLEYDLGRNEAWDHFFGLYEEARRAGPEAEWLFRNCKNVGFQFCKGARRSKVHRISGSIYDLDPTVHGTFDIVYCFGLLYHLRHPLLALDRIAAVAREKVFLNNQIIGTGRDPSGLHFFNEKWRGAYSNWFVPTPAAFLDMLGSSGFSKVEVVGLSDTAISVICYK